MRRLDRRRKRANIKYNAFLEDNVIEDNVRRFEELIARAADVRGYLDADALHFEIQSLEKRMTGVDFWKDQEAAQKVLQRRKRVESDIDLIKNLKTQEEDARVLVEWLAQGEDVGADLESALAAFGSLVESAEFQKMLGGEHDRANAILTINAGAGGTDSQDWAEMLLRMYLRWSEKRGYKRDVTDVQEGEGAGIKSATVLLQGEYAYGYLSAEVGVHRLVRISPFDANARRHTSFASVFAWPEVDEDIKIEIQDKDLRVDTYRSSGCGGQHLNVTDSAVRITHLPTGLVVSCQNERSQIRNRDLAMKVLRARLYDLELQKQRAKLEAVESAKKEIAFGSQIRSYVLHPYRMVKDHRTKHEVGDVDRVLDGDIDAFIKATLIGRVKGTLRQNAIDEERD
ncbi:MAG: peptide chain release factor 2 [Vicinamibacteria bacterium]|nr:peptide chain release factor 2 [Vicinamibacteria bacterium]